MGYSWQEYWGGLPFPPLGDLPDLGIESVSPEPPALAGGFFTTARPGKPLLCVYYVYFAKIFEKFLLLKTEIPL